MHCSLVPPRAHRLSYNVYRAGDDHHSSGRAEFRAGQEAEATSGASSIRPTCGQRLLRMSPGAAERGLSARVAITRSASGNRISAISPMALSRIAPKTKVSGRSSYKRKASSAAPRRRPDCALHRIHIRAPRPGRHRPGSVPANGFREFRAAIDSAVTGKPCWLSSSAVAIASAMLRS